MQKTNSSANANSALLLLLVVGTLLGTTAIFAKSAPLAGWPPLALLQWSMVVGAGLQVAAALVGRLRTSLSPRIFAIMAVTGFLYAVPNALAFAAAQHVGAGFVALCFAFPLVLTYGMAIVLRMETVQAARFAGVLSGVAGGIVLAVGRQVSGEALGLWALAALASPVIVALGNIYRTLYWPAGVQPLQLSIGMLGFGAATLVLINLVVGGGGGAVMLPAAWTFDAIALLAGQSLISAIMFSLYFRLQALAGPVYLSQIGSVSAIIGVGLAFLLFNEIPSGADILAAALIAAGIFLVNRRGRTPAPAA